MNRPKFRHRLLRRVADMKAWHLLSVEVVAGIAAGLATFAIGTPFATVCMAAAAMAASVVGMMYANTLACKRYLSLPVRDRMMLAAPISQEEE